MSNDLPTDYHIAEHAPVWLDYWRPRLRLMDWDIVLRVFTLKEWLERGNDHSCAGLNHAHPETGHCWINLLDPQDLPSGTPDDQRDIEHTIVHELLHLMLPLNSEVKGDPVGERRINRVAQALIRERRERQEIARELRALRDKDAVQTETTFEAT